MSLAGRYWYKAGVPSGHGHTTLVSSLMQGPLPVSMPGSSLVPTQHFELYFLYSYTHIKIEMLF
jgi:hypothetical protein